MPPVVNFLQIVATILQQVHVNVTRSGQFLTKYYRPRGIFNNAGLETMRPSPRLIGDVVPGTQIVLEPVIEGIQEIGSRNRRTLYPAAQDVGVDIIRFQNGEPI